MNESTAIPAAPLAKYDIFSTDIEGLTEHLKQESDIELRRAAEAQNAIHGITKDYYDIAKKIEDENRKAIKLTDRVRGIKEGKGAKEKGKQVLELAKYIGGKVPGVQSLKYMIGLDNPSVSKALEGQLGVAIELKNRLKELLFSDKGLESTIKRIQEKMINYGNDATSLAQELEKLKGQKNEYCEKKQELSDLLTQKHGKLETINLNALGAEDLASYNTLNEAEKNITEKEFEISKSEKKKNTLINFIAGCQTLKNTLVIYHINGQNVFYSMDQFLSEAGPHISFLADIVQTEEILTKASEITHKLVENYNNILLTSSEHAKIISEKGSDLVPSYLNKIGVLQKSSENLRQAAQTLIEGKDGPAVKHYLQNTKNLLALHNGGDKPKLAN